jgi:hypothetical protein
VVVDDGEVIPVDHRSDKGTTLEVPKIDYEWLPELCELTQRELQVLDTIVRLTTGWGRDLSAKEVAQGMKELWNVKLNADAVRHHFAKIREKAQVLRWMHWRRLLNSPSTESAERYIASLGPNPRCPVRLAATAWVLGISLGPAIKRAEVDFAYDCALRAWKRTKDLNLERHNMHAHYLSNGILAYTEILRAYVGSPNCNWENALKVCREEIQRTARTWSSLGFEHAYFLGRVARDLKLYGVAEGIQQSRPMVANPSGFTAFLEQYYPCPDLASALKRLLPRITMKPDPKCPFVGR